MKITRILSFTILILIVICSSFATKVTSKDGDKLTNEQVSDIRREIAKLTNDNKYFFNNASIKVREDSINIVRKNEKRIQNLKDKLTNAGKNYY